MSLASQIYNAFGLVDAIMEIEILTLDYRGAHRLQKDKDKIDQGAGRLPYTKHMRERWKYELRTTGPNDDKYIAQRIWLDGTVIEAPEKIFVDRSGFRQ